METSSVITCRNIKKKYRNFELNIESVDFPKGFASAIIGENGAGKTTLLEIIAGLQLDHKGDVTYFEKYSEKDRENTPDVKNRIGYTGTGNYFLPNWNMQQVREVQELLFDGFNGEKYDHMLRDMAVVSGKAFEKDKKVSALSDGNRTKLMLAGVLARDTKLLLLDEPASPLDPLMRDKLCSMIREYLAEKEGERSVVFSTHNVADMENVTDYIVIVENGEAVEQGFVEDLKEKYLYVKGEKKDEEIAKKYLFDITTNSFGYEGLCLAENIEKLAGLDIEVEAPTLMQLTVGIMRNYSKLGKIS
ncbi:ATP-binding cassette domain-containing protein [Butyrivibrio sp. YAB3001]|uniref:ATP-binding cassette domain-containing protein n=1 Tax=Butyrivibrio sp. YAB3001 TaxID=1520812 RepID=UPI0008F6190A|nr:ABC transporter ATP-binding protein [Butyrivibrio sp. YAB3001]SFC11520.1 ABC-2 type transport system ATP-binding protein [Butyrivibrio sp. YAB3001]